VGFLNLGTATAPPQPIQAKVTALSKTAKVTVAAATLGNNVPVTIETEVRQGALVQVLRAVLDPSGNFQQVFRELQNGAPARVTTYTIDAIGSRTVAATATVTPQPVPEAATLLAAATPPVLFLHGFRSDASTWDKLFTDLQNVPFKIYRRSLDAGSDNPCQQAFGDTTPGTPSLVNWISDVKKETGVQRVILVGHSQGGIVARLYLQTGTNPTAFADALTPYTGSAGEDQYLACFTWMENRGAAFKPGQVDVAGLVTYGTPHNGALSTGKLSPLLREGAPFLGLLNSFSTFKMPDGIALANILGATTAVTNTKDDCLVSVTSQNMSLLPGTPTGISITRSGWVRHTVSYLDSAAGTLCPIGAFLRTPETEDTKAILGALNAQILTINSLSPVTMVITSPSGKIIDKRSTAIWGATYGEFLDETGDKKSVVAIPFPERGTYQIRVIPDSTAVPTDVFSITTEMNGVARVLVDHAPISSALSGPFVVTQAVDNLTPIANAGPDSTVECTAPSGTSLSLNGTGSSDPDGDALSFAWTGGFGSATGIAPTVTVPLGSNIINLTVSDGKGGTASANTRVVVRDTTPPVASLTLTPNVLWPPNHSLIPITAALQVSDQCDSKPTLSLVSITSNQPDSGLDKDDVPGDIQGATFGTDDRTFLLRAERAGEKAKGLTLAQIKLGRIYTVTYRVFDKAGNATTASGQVKVPYSQ